MAEAQPEPRPVPALALRGVIVRAEAGRERRVILKADRLDVAPGEAVAIRGPSGAGKSTLLHALAGLLAPAEGAIRWGDADIARMSEGARDRFRHRTIGLVFQDFLLFEELGALGNAAVAASYAPRGERPALRARAGALLERLGIPASTRDVSSFSGGERQRVAVARALATDPAVLLADEPTASLDRANADRLVADLLALARERGRTIIAVSHDPSVTAAMDRVVEVVDGVLRT